MMKVCLCPSSVLWVTRHLKASAKAQWKKMIKRNKPTKKRKSSKTKRKRAKGSGPKRRKSQKLKTISTGGGMKKKRKLKAGIHLVKMKGGRIRRVRVLRNGQWRFMKRFG